MKTFILQIDSTKVSLEKVAESLAKDPSGTLQHFLESAIHFGIKVLAAIAIYIVGAWIIKKIKKNLNRLFERKQTDAALAGFISSIASITLTILLVVITISTLGINTTSFAALLAAGGVAIGASLSGTVQNFAGGIMILAFKPFKSGDFIEAQGYSGTVTTVSIVSTTLTTPDNRTVIIPNGALFNGNINNFSKNPLRRVDWDLSVEYGTDAQECKKLILEIISSDKRVLDSKTEGANDPFAELSSLADSSVVFKVRAWCKTGDYWDVYFDLLTRLYNELPKSGISFAFPHLDVNIKS